ncbi:MAG: glycosyl hydrolase, partial [Candidatus Hydrogenedentales bacterium]
MLSADSPRHIFQLLTALLVFHAGLSAGAVDQKIRSDFAAPPDECRPRTYWFWPGSAVTREEITWELQQMHEQGLGGVLINSAFSPIYEKGAIPFLSDDYLAMLRHAVLTARELNMKVTLNFSGGWVFGGFWVPPDERSQSLVPASVDIIGPRDFSDELPRYVKMADPRGEVSVADIPNVDKLVAVVAARTVNGIMEADSLVDLTSRVKGTRISWSAPAGAWRLMAFWLKPTGQRTVGPDYGQEHWCVDHFSRTAMKNYCDFIGGKFYQAVGDEFGKTVEALHCDSFEMANLPNGISWSDGLMAEFQHHKGYDLAKYLPALWWKVGEISPKVKYDVNDFLAHAGHEIFFNTYLTWCHEHHVKASMEPYGFPTDTLEGAGAADLPFMEITPGEKDAVPWFDTRIGPRRYVASGADLYGRNIVGVEAYTYLHWEIFRATLEELKIASDGFLCAGANQFYNHLYCYTPEREAAPSRVLPWEAVINHTNVWWKHYRQLSGYLDRCCSMLRLGSPQKDVAVYSPLANQWTLDVQNARKWTRDFYWG